MGIIFTHAKTGTLLTPLNKQANKENQEISLLINLIHTFQLALILDAFCGRILAILQIEFAHNFPPTI